MCRPKACHSIRSLKMPTRNLHFTNFAIHTSYPPFMHPPAYNPPSLSIRTLPRWISNLFSLALSTFGFHRRRDMAAQEDTELHEWNGRRHFVSMHMDC